MKLHIKFTKAAWPSRYAVLRTLQMWFNTQADKVTGRFLKNRTGLWVLIELPGLDEDNVTLQYSSRGFKHLNTGVEE